MSNGSDNQTISTQNTNGNLLMELFLNLCLPTIILLKGHTWFHLPPKLALALAMGCPLAYGICDWVREKRFNWIAFLGLISISVKGSIGLLEFSNKWLAFNEALLPGIMAFTIIIFRLMKRPPFLIHFLLNDQFCYTDKITKLLKEKNNYTKLIHKVYVYEWLLAALFCFSSTLNFILAKYLVIHPAGSDTFNHELGMLTAWSFAVIAVPATIALLGIAWRFFVQVKVLSNLKWEEIIRE